MTAGYARYREVDVLTMSPAQRVVLLYTRLLVALKSAKTLDQERHFERRAEQLVTAQEIVNELLVSLDREQGGEIAARLATLYSYFLAELATLGARRDAERLDRLIRMAGELHDAWRQAAEQLARASAAPDAAP